MNKLFLVVGICFIIFSCKKEEKKAVVEDVLTVSLSSVQKVSLTDQISASGVLSSKEEIKLAFKTGGLIKKIYVSEGQSVKAGQLLAELDLSEIDAQVKQASLGFEKAKRDLDRVKKLLADEAATQTNLDDATTGYEAASQNLQIAKYNLKLSKIYAPQSGRILRKISEAGELITPFAPALILGTGSSAFNVNVGLSDREIVKIQKGFPATISLDAYPNQSFTAAVTQIAETINPATGTFEVELTMDKTNEKLISGFVAKASISPPNQAMVLGIPIECLVEANGKKAYVFVYENGIALKKEVILGKIGEKEVEILSGLNESQQIVNQGANFLSDGQKIKVTK